MNMLKTPGTGVNVKGMVPPILPHKSTLSHFLTFCNSKEGEMFLNQEQPTFKSQVGAPSSSTLPSVIQHQQPHHHQPSMRNIFTVANNHVFSLWTCAMPFIKPTPSRSVPFHPHSEAVFRISFNSKKISNVISVMWCDFVSFFVL